MKPTQPCYEKRLEVFELGLKKTIESISEIVEVFVDRIRQSFVLPYCAKKNYTFVSGMGTYFFVDESDLVVDENAEDVEPELALIFKVLDNEIVGRFSVGEYMNDVKVEDVKEYGDEKN